MLVVSVVFALRVYTARVCIFEAQNTSKTFVRSRRVRRVNARLCVLSYSLKHWTPLMSTWESKLANFSFSLILVNFLSDAASFLSFSLHFVVFIRSHFIHPLRIRFHFFSFLSLFFLVALFVTEHFFPLLFAVFVFFSENS